MSERLSIVIPSDLKEELDQLRKRMHMDQSSLIRQLLGEAIQQKRLELALAEYANRKISLGNAADLAGVNLWQFLDELHKRHISLDYSLEDAEREIAGIHAGTYKKFLPMKTKSRSPLGYRNGM